MRILSCHIENYGSISNRDIVFSDDGVTAFCEDNGYGKSTLASFLKAMFYGLDPVRTNSKDFSERKHFYPFDGGAFGGNVRFVLGGEEYKIERYFDEKSDLKDSVTVYRNGICDLTLEGNIGEKIFGIDRQSFERTAFITSDDIEIASTGSINAKLNNLVAGGDDSDLEAALEKLEKKIKIYKKSRQGNDKITQANQKLAELSAKIANCETIEKTLPEKNKKLKEFSDEIAALQAEITAAQTNNLILNDWDTYDGFIKESETAIAHAESLKNGYPVGIPQKSEIDAAREILKQNEILSAQSQKKTFSPQDEERFTILNAHYCGGVPSEAELAKIKEDIVKSASLDAEITTLKSGELSEEHLKLKQKFLYHCPGTDELEEIDKEAEKYRTLETECSALSDFTENDAAPSAAKNKHGKVFILLAAVFAAVAIVGAGLLFASTLAGALTLAAGAVALLAEGFVYLNGKSSRAAGATAQVENSEKRKKTEELRAVREKIGALTGVYGYTLENGAVYAVKCLESDVKRFKALSDEQNEKSVALQNKQSERDELNNKLDAFFSKYQKSGAKYIDLLSTLNAETAEFASLKDRRELSLSGEADSRKALEENRAALLPFIKKYGVEFADIKSYLDRAERDLNAFTELTKIAVERKRKAENFASEKKLTSRPDAAKADLAELNERLTCAIDGKNSLLIDVTSCESSAEQLGELYDEYDETKQKLDEYKKIYGILTKTSDKLIAADRKLKDKYIKPVRDRFILYSSLLEKTLGEKLTFNTNFEIRYERGGKERSEKHLSSGQKSILALCFRLALIDNMYSKEKPFIILDDPFVHLDSAHFKKVKNMIARLSEDMQLIYFTCHESRKI